MDNDDILDENEIFMNNLNSTLFVKKDYDMKEFDYDWIDIIEDVNPYIDNILRNPKKFIVNEEEIVKVELARRVTVESVIHLTQHTNFIQKIEDNGDVKPSKILNINREESLDTYENRFIYTLINNLRNFYQERLEATSGNSYCNDKNELKYEANTKINSEDIKISLQLEDSLKNKKTTSGSKDNLSLEERLTKIKYQLDAFLGSELYQTLNKLHVPPVRSPIRKTNVILKNPNFKKAEELWNYIQTYENRDKKETDKRSFYDKGLLKKEYDQAFLATYIANKNLITKSKGISLNNLINLSIARLIDNLLDSDEELTEEKIKELFLKQIKQTKEKNMSRANSVYNIIEDRLNRENNKLNTILEILEGENI